MLEVEGIYCKLEYLNPSGSIKARIAKYMVERAEDEGLLRPAIPSSRPRRATQATPSRWSPRSKATGCSS